MFTVKPPVRTCIGCRGRTQAGDLVRVVAAPPSSEAPVIAGVSYIEVDERRRKPGRGAWVHPNPECVALAEKRRAFGRALRLTGLVDAVAVADHVGRITASSAAASADGSRPNVSRK